MKPNFRMYQVYCKDCSRTIEIHQLIKEPLKDVVICDRCEKHLKEFHVYEFTTHKDSDMVLCKHSTSFNNYLLRHRKTKEFFSDRAEINNFEIIYNTSKV